ncbi:MAG: DUF4974 domain-containing protein [Lunatimonas sp.]|uniref:FecR family protein n=1 Tax=Lunatimonas sp. TaxID=2060141 RepID=UPI00263A955E|nr:FecR family protein [Lunatimonas sp.]MCC5935886.1 DUF4974 domain-containing protein [Lunatimonas sp.]
MVKRLVETWRRLMVGSLSEKESSDFIKELESDEGKRLFYKAVESSFTDPTTSEAYSDWDKERVLQQLLEKKRKTDRHWSVPFLRPKKWYAAVAASLVFGTFFFTGALEFPDAEPVPAADGVEEPTIVVKYNPKGKKTKIQLPDLTWVYLNADSYLAYEQGFPNGREVRLVGEAFFDVAKDSLRPFTVLTGSVHTTALGTSFNIHAYSDSRQIQVTLATGKVRVQDQVSASELHLLPGEALAKGDSHVPMRKYSVDADAIVSWKDGVLQFEQMPLSDVVRLLERWYGVTIHGPSVWPEYKCSGTFRKNEYLTNVLKVLGHSIGFRYTIDEKHITIHIKP